MENTSIYKEYKEIVGNIRPYDCSQLIAINLMIRNKLEEANNHTNHNVYDVQMIEDQIELLCEKEKEYTKLTTYKFPNIHELSVTNYGPTYDYLDSVIENMERLYNDIDSGDMDIHNASTKIATVLKEISDLNVYCFAAKVSDLRKYSEYKTFIESLYEELLHVYFNYEINKFPEYIEYLYSNDIIGLI
jgi:hypothetical protein